MKILVVGGTGVLGRHVVPMLLVRGHEVTVLSPGRRADGLPASAGHVRASLVEPETTDLLVGILPGYDAVVNIATAIPADPGAPGAWDRNTLLRERGTWALADAIRFAGPQRLVQMSISMVYPDGADTWLTESTPLDPDPRRAALVAPVRAMEDAVRTLPPADVRWTILRGARFVGPGTVQDQQIAQLRAGRLPVAGDGRRFVSMVHVRDFAGAVVAATTAGLPGAVLNVADEPVRAAGYLDRLARLTGAPVPDRDPAAPPDLPSQRVSSLAARERLGWSPRHGIWPTG